VPPTVITTLNIIPIIKSNATLPVKLIHIITILANTSKTNN
jgi:hypothetical protein